MKKRQPKAHSLEFREEAMRLVRAGTTPIRRLSREPGLARRVAADITHVPTCGTLHHPGRRELLRHARRGAAGPRGVHRGVVQSGAAALVARLPIAGAIRSAGTEGRLTWLSTTLGELQP